MYAVHSIHAPAIEIDGHGRATHNGKDMFQLPVPLFAAETREEAEEWRLGMLQGREA